MKKQLITYDLNDPGQNYQRIVDAIKKYPWAKICYSAWAIKTNESPASLRDKFKQYIDSSDDLFVSEITDWASWGLSKEVVDWLNSN